MIGYLSGVCAFIHATSGDIFNGDPEAWFRNGSGAVPQPTASIATETYSSVIKMTVTAAFSNLNAAVTVILMTLEYVSVAMLAVGCGTAPEPLRNHASGSPLKISPEVACMNAQTPDRYPIIRYQVRNISSETVYILDGDRMPYQIADDSNMLVILQGVNS